MAVLSSYPVQNTLGGWRAGWVAKWVVGSCSASGTHCEGWSSLREGSRTKILLMGIASLSSLVYEYSDTTEFSQPCTHGKGTSYKTNCLKSLNLCTHPVASTLSDTISMVHLANTLILRRCTRRKQAMSYAWVHPSSHCHRDWLSVTTSNTGLCIPKQLLLNTWWDLQVPS